MKKLLITFSDEQEAWLRDHASSHFPAGVSELVRRTVDQYRLQENKAVNTTTAAEVRVSRNENLKPFTDLLLRYDWSNMDEHLEWVATAPEADIVDWCQMARKQEAQDEDREMG